MNNVCTTLMYNTMEGKTGRQTDKNNDITLLKTSLTSPNYPCLSVLYLRCIWGWHKGAPEVLLVLLTSRADRWTVPPQPSYSDWRKVTSHHRRKGKMLIGGPCSESVLKMRLRIWSWSCSCANGKQALRCGYLRRANTSIATHSFFLWRKDAHTSSLRWPAAQPIGCNPLRFPAPGRNPGMVGCMVVKFKAGSTTFCWTRALTHQATAFTLLFRCFLSREAFWLDKKKKTWQTFLTFMHFLSQFQKAFRVIFTSIISFGVHRTGY